MRLPRSWSPQYGWEWDYYVFFVDFGLYTVISILGLWFHEVRIAHSAHESQAVAATS